MASFGEELKRERELRDISLKEIAEATKISIRFLEALECNNFDILPGGIFNRGFIRAYARFIGVDGEEMVNSYLQELANQESRKTRQSPLPTAPGQPQKPPSPTQAPPTATRAQEGFFRPQRSKARAPQHRPGAVTSIEDVETFKPKLPEGTGSSRNTTILWVAVAATLLVGGAAVTFKQLGGGSDPGPSDGVAAGAPRPQEASTAPPAQSAGVLKSEPEPEPDDSADAPAGSEGSPAEPADPEETAPAQATVHSLWVLATEVNHIRIECDDEVALDQELWPGQSRTVRCPPPARLSALNAGALQYSIDGGPSRLLGEIGQRVERVTVIQPVEPEPQGEGGQP